MSACSIEAEVFTAGTRLGTHDFQLVSRGRHADCRASSQHELDFVRIKSSLPVQDGEGTGHDPRILDRIETQVLHLVGHEIEVAKSETGAKVLGSSTEIEADQAIFVRWSLQESGFGFGIPHLAWRKVVKERFSHWRR
jgi:hypothetical protein